MLFKVDNTSIGRSTHCGVLEFVAQEGHVYLPRWVSRMLQHLERGAMQCVISEHTCRLVALEFADSHCIRMPSQAYLVQLN